ncbi:MAG: hypothetical protein J7485_07980 [Sphingobium sp.]|nr:hypothetical protein [Sphingobium sp.]
MAISESNAAEALRSVSHVQRRTLLAKGYSQASPHLALSGVIWAAGYIASGLTPPESWPLFWVPLAFIGVFGSFALSFRGARPVAGDLAARVMPAARMLWTIGASMAFGASTFLLFQPKDMVPALAFPALFLAYVYVLVGATGASRYLWIGGGVFTVTALGLILMPQAIAFWVAAAGGGGLLAGALWMRKP